MEKEQVYTVVDGSEKSKSEVLQAGKALIGKFTAKEKFY